MDGTYASLISFEKIYVGLSGGLDSCVLLHQLSQKPLLQHKLCAIHINHQLSPHANEWENFSENFAHSLNISFKSFCVTLKNKLSNIEESARHARYEIFSSLLKNKNEILVLAHHQNDQAETLLLHLFRGAGLDGLSAMPEWRALGNGKIYRPLLSFSRADLEKYAMEKKLKWIDDESNENTNFNRNFLRHNIIPELQKRWPALITNLSRSAQHCASAKKIIHKKIAQDLEKIIDEKNKLSIEKLLKYSHDEQCFLLREWLALQHFKKPSQDKIIRVLNELILSKPDANPIVSWKEGCVRRYQGFLYAIKKDTQAIACNEATEKALTELKKQYPTANFEIRFRKGGEKIRWHGQTHSLKKLLQEWKIPPWEREHIPLIYKNNELIKALII